VLFDAAVIRPAAPGLHTASNSEASNHGGENEGILFATVVAVTVPPISPSMNLIASRTKSIFHWGKAGRRGTFIAASTDMVRASMTSNRQL
jgi:hypothetical protein